MGNALPKCATRVVFAASSTSSRDQVSSLDLLHGLAVRVRGPEVPVGLRAGPRGDRIGSTKPFAGP